MRKGKNETQLTYINRCDNYSTIKEAFDLLFYYVNVKNKNVYFPFYNEGLINSYHFDCVVIHNDTDFFETTDNNNGAFAPLTPLQKKDFDYIVDNPPYTIKEKCIKKCLELNKPFALLLPIDTLERKYISTLFKDKDFTIIIPKNRYRFINNNCKITMPFKTCWFCVGFDLKRNIIFE